MRFATFLVVLPFIAASAQAGATTSTPTAISHSINPRSAHLTSVALYPRDPITNAQRIARGLSPKRPRFHSRRSSTRALFPRASPAPGGPNPGCTTLTGTLAAAGTGVPPAALISRTPNAFGEYGITTDAADALRVRATVCAAERASGDPVDLFALNGIADYGLLGGIVGFDSTSPDLDAGSANYLYLGGTTETVPGSTPQVQANSFTQATDAQEQVESAIWLLNPTNGGVDIRWVNTDGDAPATTVLWYESENFLVVTGDAAAFEAAYGANPVVTLTFVQG